MAIGNRKKNPSTIPAFLKYSLGTTAVFHEKINLASVIEIMKHERKPI